MYKEMFGVCVAAIRRASGIDFKRRRRSMNQPLAGRLLDNGILLPALHCQCSTSSTLRLQVALCVDSAGPIHNTPGSGANWHRSSALC